MEELLKVLKKIEEGSVDISYVPPSNFTLRDVVIANYIVDVYQGQGVRDSEVRPGDMLEWFTNTPRNEAVFHLWNAWHRS